MKYIVNEGCIGCGFCAATCPEVFSMTADGTATAIDADVPQGSEDSAAEACDGCPAEVIVEVREYAV